jgi:predicted CopG family antitoxin
MEQENKNKIKTMKDRGKTTIQISDVLWKKLNKRKRTGETFEDVINDLLQIKATLTQG